MLKNPTTSFIIFQSGTLENALLHRPLCGPWDHSGFRSVTQPIRPNSVKSHGCQYFASRCSTFWPSIQFNFDPQNQPSGLCQFSFRQLAVPTTPNSCPTVMCLCQVADNGHLVDITSSNRHEHATTRFWPAARLRWQHASLPSVPLASDSSSGLS